jgi:hypothetical protein
VSGINIGVKMYLKDVVQNFAFLQIIRALLEDFICELFNSVGITVRIEFKTQALTDILQWKEWLASIPNGKLLTNQRTEG